VAAGNRRACPGKEGTRPEAQPLLGVAVVTIAVVVTVLVVLRRGIRRAGPR